MHIQRHPGLRQLFVLALVLGLVGALPVTAHGRNPARQDVARLAAGLEAATDDVRRELRGGFFGRRGGDAQLEREIGELQRHAAHFRREVRRRGPQAARSDLAALLQRFYDADREIRRTAVSGHARSEFERARFFMDTLIDRYGGYRQFQHVRPSGNHGRHRWDRDDRRWQDHRRRRPAERRRWEREDRGADRRGRGARP